MWGFPDFVVKAARYHHHLRHDVVGAPAVRLLEIVTFANQICHWICLCPAKIDMELFQAMAAKFGLTTDSEAEALVNSLMPLAKTV